jgi:DedD protein
MGLLDIFTKRDSAGATPASATVNVMTGEQAEQARVRAKRRLMGAVVLLGVGVIAFPLLFETQPRPIPVDIPIVIPPRDGSPPLALPAPRAATRPAASVPVVDTPAASEPVQAEVKPAETPAPVATPAAATSKEPAAPPKPVAKAEPKAEPKTEPKPEPVAPKPVAAGAGRFVVQIGAFAEDSAVRDVRSKAEKAGLATFTQVVKTADGRRTRVRIGPFSSREDAEKAAARAKSIGLAGSVLTL